MGIIKKQGIQNAIITYVGIVIGFFNLLVIQPYFLRPEEVGLVRVLFSFSVLVATVIPLGIGNITTRYFPLFKNQEKKHHGFFGFMLLFPLIGFALTSLILLFFKDYFVLQYSKDSPLFANYFLYVFPFCLILGLVTIFNNYCFSLFKTSLPTFLNDIFVRVFSIILFAIYFLKWISLDQMILLYVIIYFLQLLALVFYILLIDKPSIKIDRQFLKSQQPKKIISFGLLLTFASFSSLSLKYLDSVMLVGLGVSLDLVGVYAIAAFVPTIIEAPIAALEKISNAKIADAFVRKDYTEIQSIYAQSTKYFLLLGGLLFLGITLNIKDLLTFLPAVYQQGGYVVWIISCGALINMATGVNNAILFYSPYYKTGTYLLYFLVVLAVVNNLIFIPLFKLEGAALATALSSLVYNMLKYFLIWKKYGFQPLNKGTFKIVITILFSGLIGVLIPSGDQVIYSIVIRSLLITVSYTFLIIFLRITPEFHRYLPFKMKK